MDLSKPQKFDTCRGQMLFYVPAISQLLFTVLLKFLLPFLSCLEL